MGGAHFLPSLPLSLRVRVRVHFHASRVNVVRIQRFASIDKSCAQVSPRAYYHPRRTHARCGKAFAQLPACRVMVRVRRRSEEELLVTISNYFFVRVYYVCLRTSWTLHT